MDNEKISAVTLVRDYFKANMDDFKKLTSKDRIELGSGIARERGLTADQINFETVPY